MVYVSSALRSTTKWLPEICRSRSRTSCVASLPMFKGDLVKSNEVPADWPEVTSRYAI
jgi:hypothetical protein